MTTAKDFLGVGWKFPVNVDGRGRIQMSRYEDGIKESIRIILSTSRGERMMRPDFGSGMQDFVFATLDTATIVSIETSVQESLDMHEPRIELLNVEVSAEEAGQGKLLVSIDYRVRDTGNEFNMVYPFYLTEER